MAFPAPSGVITLLTDFGLADPFVGQMKGVILTRCPNARVVDLSHGIAPGDVAAGSFWLERSWSCFAKGTVHVAVVDPGVGTARAALAVWAHHHWFVGPDNGLLAAVLATAHDPQVRRIEPLRLGMVPASRTFHGRDLFAPVAAALAAGRVGFPALGPQVEQWVPSLLPAPELRADGAVGVVVTVDHFGNLITNLGADILQRVSHPMVRIGSHTVPLVGTFHEAPPGALLALPGSMGVLEIARRDGSAHQLLGLGRGTPVTLVGAEGRR